MPETRDEVVARLRAALSRTDVASTAIGEAEIGIAARIKRLVEKLLNAVSLEEAVALADGFTAEAAQIEAHAAVLGPMAKDENDPVPVPVPEPPAPGPTNDPQSFRRR
jgi:hypothetical protein